eukprot:scaffold448391_cov29-Prasinocladus_malaysianus.AAC.1
MPVLVSQDEEAFKAVSKNQSGSRPRELFDDVIEELQEKYEKNKLANTPRQMACLTSILLRGSAFPNVPCAP